MITFLHGTRQLNPPSLATIPVWDLTLILNDMTRPPFELFQSASLKVLSQDSLHSLERIYMLSVNESCLSYGVNDSKVVLKPSKVYIPKVLSTLFRNKVITLPAFT